jgi:cation:H+ antiporter
VTDRVIGLTIVAVGTSLPELFASVAAAKKGQTDMAIGNVVGSAIFNILSVVGISAAICPIENSNAGFLTDYIVMVGLSGLLWFFLFTKRTLERWEGVTLVTIYAAYIACTVIFS